MGRFITAQEVPAATDYLFRNDKQVFKAVSNGVLRAPTVVRVGRRMYFDREALATFIENGRRALDGGWKHDPGTDGNSEAAGSNRG